MRSFFRKFFIFLSVIILAAVISIFIFDVNYIYKALIYQHPNIDDLHLFPYRKIDAPQQKWDWKLAKDYNKKPLTPTLDKLLKDYRAAAFLVIKNDSIKYEKYWDGYADTTHSNSFSVAKSIISLLTGIAIEEGKIKSIDQPVSDFLPDFKEGDKAKITVRHLLTMSSGLDFMESYSSPFNYTTESYYGTDLRKMIGKLKVIEEPGSVYRYKSGDTQIMQMVLKAATGKEISEYASEKLWKKIGASADAYWSLDKKGGDEKAYCCIYSTARDLARIGELYLHKGNFQGQQIISPGWVDSSVAAHDLEGDDGKQYPIYGYSWWLMKRKGNNIFYASGLHGQYIICIPEKHIIIIRLGHDRPSARVYGHRIDVITYIDEVLKRYGEGEVMKVKERVN